MTFFSSKKSCGENDVGSCPHCHLRSRLADNPPRRLPRPRISLPGSHPAAILEEVSRGDANLPDPRQGPASAERATALFLKARITRRHQQTTPRVFHLPSASCLDPALQRCR